MKNSRPPALCHTYNQHNAKMAPVSPQSYACQWLPRLLLYMSWLCLSSSILSLVESGKLFG